MIPRLCCVVLAALCAWNALAQFDQPVNPDSVRADSLSAWPDTSAAVPDTLVPPPHAPLRHGWLYPLGLAMVTCLGFVMLYTTRSR